MLLVLAVRVRLREMPLERDEGEYAYAGQLLLDGILPYEQAYNMKLPGAYAAFAVIEALFGQTPAGIRLGLMVVTLGSVLLVFALGRRLRDAETGGVAALIFALLSLNPSLLGLHAHASHFVVFFVLAGLYTLMFATEARDLSSGIERGLFSGLGLRLFGSGVLFGLAILMKQHGLFFPLAAGLYLIGLRRGWWSEAPVPELSTKRLGAFAAGVLVPYLVVCAVMAYVRLFPQFVFWTITYAQRYALGGNLLGLQMLWPHLWQSVLKPTLAFWLLAGLGLVSLWREPLLRPRHRFLLLLLASGSLISICPGLVFRAHYFLQLLPAAALLGGLAIRGLFTRPASRGLWLRLPAAAAVVAVVWTAAALDGPFWFNDSPVQVVRLIHHSSLFEAAAAMGEYLKTNAPANQPIAVIGSEPEIYFLAQRHSSTGFIYTYSLMDPRPHALPLQNWMIEEIEHNPPSCVVFVDDPTSWSQRPNSPHRIFDWWNAYCATNMTRVMAIPIDTDADPSNPAPPGSQSLVLFRRNDLLPAQEPPKAQR
jgi:hypothetical protein